MQDQRGDLVTIMLKESLTWDVGWSKGLLRLAMASTNNEHGPSRGSTYHGGAGRFLGPAVRYGKDGSAAGVGTLDQGTGRVRPAAIVGDSRSSWSPARVVSRCIKEWNYLYADRRVGDLMEWFQPSEE